MKIFFKIPKSMFKSQKMKRKIKVEVEKKNEKNKNKLKLINYFCMILQIYKF